MSLTRVDPHVKVLDDAVVERAKARGLDVLVYAPHFRRLPEIKEAAAAYTDEDLLIVPGREIFTGTWRNRRHVLAIAPPNPIPDFITFEGAMAVLAEAECPVLVPHPTFLSVSCSKADVGTYRELIDAVETYNPKHLAHHNARAAEVARESALPVFGSSYAHLRGTVGEVWTEFDAEIDDVEALVEAFKSGTRRTVRRRHGPRHRARCLAEFAHLGWENSWKKADRVLLSGMEATHPSHVAYDGQFEDIAVYRDD
ncbi:MAG: PHP-associated domain-containing protein [Halobacteriaceae archaeon]